MPTGRKHRAGFGSGVGVVRVEALCGVGTAVDVQGGPQSPPAGLSHLSSPETGHYRVTAGAFPHRHSLHTALVLNSLSFRLRQQTLGKGQAAGVVEGLI